jgi:tRNA wybutosine-synthesizing protein 4
LLAKQSAACRNAVFIDVDYEALMQTKRDVIVQTPQLYEILSGFHTTAPDKAVLLTSMHYTAIGCDLTNTTRLEAAIKSELALDNCDVLFLAEVSLTYMETSAADAVILWASKLTKSVQFCLLEQFLPGGADHPFAMTMLKHFEKLQAPLRSILQYPTLEKQLERFFESGWETVRAKSLWECWQGSTFTSAERRRLDSVESFDEWEEFALFASHYFILEARSIGDPDSGWKEVYEAEMQHQDDEELETMPPVPEALSSLRLTYHEASKVKGRRRYGAVLNQKDSVIGLHGGLGSKSRLRSTDVYGNPNKSPFELCLPPSEVSARMLHTITYLSDDECLLVGGRSSPDKAMVDCWLRKMNCWRPVSDLPTARYRHCATKVGSLDGPPGVLVHGGKQNASHVLGDWLLWEPSTGWQYPGLNGQNGMLPAPRFSASLVCLENSKGLLFGGISEDGRVLRDIWFWKLSRCDGRPLLEFQNHTKSFERHNSTGTHNLDGSIIDRFGAVAWPVKGGLTVVGGISTYGAHEIWNEIVHIRFQKAVDGVYSRAALDYPYTHPAAGVREGIAMEGFRTTEGATAEQPGTDSAYEYISDRVSLLKWSTFCQVPVRPLLVGHAAVVADAKRVVIFGGGAVCFSFGTHWNEGTWSLHETSETEDRTPWVLLAADQEKERHMEPNHAIQHNSAQVKGYLRASERIEIKSATEFDELVAKSQPVILKNMDIGPCVNLWTVEYLRSEIGSDRIVSVSNPKR